MRSVAVADIWMVLFLLSQHSGEGTAEPEVRLGAWLLPGEKWFDQHLWDPALLCHSDGCTYCILTQDWYFSCLSFVQM